MKKNTKSKPQFRLKKMSLILAASSLASVVQLFPVTVNAEERDSEKINADGSLDLDVVTIEGHAQYNNLPEVYAGGQVARGARLGLLGNVDVMDTPFNVTSYTSAIMEDQQSKTVADVLQNDASVRFTTSDNHNSENFTIRGLDLNSYDLAFNGMYNVLPATHVPTQFLERVEVFRGPAAMLSGISPQGGIAGVINLVPKRASDEPITRLSASYESDARFGTGLDVGRRFGENNEFGVRFNSYVADGETTLDDQEKEEQLYAVGLDYQADVWRVELDLYHSIQNQNDGSPLMVGFGSLGHVLSASDATTNLLKGTYADQVTNGFAFRGEYDLNDTWTTWASLGGSKYKYEGFINGTRVIVANDNGDTVNTQTYHQKGYRSGLSTEIGVRGAFSTGALDHELSLSLSALQTRTGLAPVSRSSTYSTNIYNPILPTIADKPTDPVQKNRDDTYTSYNLIDTVSAMNDRVLVTLGGRLQRVRQSFASPTAYDEDALTPMLGLVLKPWGESISIYGNYIEGLSPGATVSVSYDNAYEALAPYESKQSEVGVKWDQGSFTNTVSLFRIEVPAFGSVNGTNVFGQNGDQVNSGFEWNTFGQVTSTVRVLGGASYTRAKVSSTGSETTNAYGVPRWTANLGAEWDTPWVEGLTLSSRVTYTGSQYLNSSNDMKIPTWTRVDIGARYVSSVAGKDLTLRAGVDNLFNREYWSGVYNDGYTTWGSSRAVSVSASVDF
jgi:iron complex outermembrane receptor protein